MPTIPPAITPVPTPAPVRGDKATFRGRVDAFVTWLSTGVAQLAAAVTNCYNNAVSAYDSAVAAAASAANAAASANVTVWVSGTTYVAGDCRWSPIDFLTYRRKTDGAGTTDPSADSTNWGLLFDGYLHTQNSISANYTLVLSDGHGKHIFHPSTDATDRVITVPANASVAFPTGTKIPIVNQVGAGKITVGITTDTLQVGGNPSATSLVIYPGEEAELLKTGTTVWEIAKTKYVVPYIYVREEQASGTTGGSLASGGFVQRILNTKVVDSHSLATLSANRLNIPVGRYRFAFSAPAFGVNAHKSKLLDFTNSISYIGSSEYCAASVAETTRSVGEGEFTITAAADFEIDTVVGTTNAIGGGGALGFGVAEVYSELQLWKVA